MPKVSITSDGKFSVWLSSMRDLSRTEAAIGLLSSKASAAHGDGVTNVDVGTWMEFGTTGPDGKVHVPSRPFLRSTLETRRQRIQEFAARRIRRVMAQKSTADIAFSEIGAFVVGEVQKRIASNTPPFVALDERTIERKGSSKPLIDSGQLRSAISYEVRKR